MVASLYFLDIAQDCSLGQDQTSSRAETSNKNVGVEMIFSILMSSSILSNLRVFFIVYISKLNEVFFIYLILF